MLETEMYTQPQAREEYADPTRMKKLGQEQPPMDPYMRRMIMAQALGGGGQQAGGMSPMGSAMGRLARGMGQGMAWGQGGDEQQKGAGIMGVLGRLFGGQAKGF